MRTSLLVLVALLCVPAASAAGPWLGTATNGVAHFSTVYGYATKATLVYDGTRNIAVPGDWGLARVTMNGVVGGLSSDGRTLVLAQANVLHPDGRLAKQSSFAVLSTKPLRVRRIVTIKGDLGFDALSPHGRTLYLIQRVSSEALTKYRVRAYDLVEHRLLTRAIADREQRGWLMDGYPMARATSPSGRWIYTLYWNPDNYPFVHALDSVNRTAICIGIPITWTTGQQTIDNSTLRVEGNKLVISSGYVLDRTTFKVTKTKS